MTTGALRPPTLETSSAKSGTGDSEEQEGARASIHDTSLYTFT